MTHAHVETVESRLRTIESLSPFAGWPADARARLARASRAASWPRDATLIRDGAQLDRLVFVRGPVQASVTAASGRRVIYSLAPEGGMYGFAPLVDGLPMQHELSTLAPARGLLIPFAAVRAELDASPGLWASVAREATSRGRRFFGRMREQTFDAPRVHMAALLLGLARPDDASVGAGSADLSVRLSLNRLAEMLGVSRQWATQLVHELTAAGLVSWRYSRVTLLDLEGLRALASVGINGRPAPSYADLAVRPQRRA
jgi:CRP/FNR family transcriptional regulator, cyclic AMP receptor protein